MQTTLDTGSNVNAQVFHTTYMILCAGTAQTWINYIFCLGPNDTNTYPLHVDAFFTPW